MIIVMLAAIVQAVASPPPGNMDSFLDQKIGSVTGRPNDALADLTMRQMMRVSTLSPLRLTEMRCAGRALDRRTGVAPPVAERLVKAVAPAVGREAGIEPGMAERLVRMFAGEDSKPRDVTACRSLWAAGPTGTVPILPVIDPNLTEPAAVSCHAQYAAAARRSSGEEQAGLEKNAADFRAMALAGRTEKAAEIERLLSTMTDALAATGFGASEDDLMNLVVCQPLRRAARER